MSPDRLPQLDAEPRTLVLDADTAATRLQELARQGHATAGECKRIRRMLAERATAADLTLLAHLAALAPALVARRAIIRAHRAAYRRGETITLEEIMADTETPLDLPALRTTLHDFKAAQQAAAEAPPHRTRALAELEPDFARARAAEEPGRAEAARIRPRLEAITADLHGLLDDPRYSRDLTWTRTALEGLGALVMERDTDAARIKSIEARPFEGVFSVQEAREALRWLADRPRVLRAELDRLERLYGGLLHRIAGLTAAPPAPIAQLPGQPRQTHATSETAA